MKKIYFFLLLVVGMLTTSATMNAEVYRSVVFNRADGTKVAITVQQGMTTQVAHGCVIMNFEEGVINYPCSDFKSWTFSTEPGLDFSAGMSAPNADLVEVAFDTGRITLNGLSDNSIVMLTAINGSVVNKTVASGSVTIPVENITPGIYVLTYNDKSIKISLK